MPLGIRPKVVKHCPEGHVMEMAWRSCPRCTGGSAVRQEPGRDMAERTILFGAPPVIEPAPAPPPPDWVAAFDVVQGPFAGTVVEIRPGRWKIGRAPHDEAGFQVVRLADPGMSREHFALEAGIAAVVMRDLGSTNGTFVNGARTEHRILQEGDVIRAGESGFRVRLAPRAPS